MTDDSLNKQNERGGATLITTIVVLLLLTVLAMGLLHMSTGNIQSAGGYQSSEQAFNVAEAGLEMVGRTYITNYYAAINYLFANRADVTTLPDPNFGDLDALISHSGTNGAFYATYFSQFPQFTGELQIDRETGLSGTYYVRIIDNDVLTLDDGNYYNRYEDEDGDYYNNVIQPNFTIDRDHNLMIQSRSIIRKGNTIIATKLVTARFCTIPEASGSQVSQSAANVNLTPAFCKQPWLVKQ